LKLQFLGAARQVTGSQYYVEADGARLLVDCGMFQERAYLGRNWDPSPLPLGRIDAVLLTHAHVDHCGLAPKLVREGLRAPIFATAPSVDLIELVLRDSAEIQVEDAAFKRKRHRKEGRRGKYPEKPLYDLEDVERTLPRLEAVPYEKETKVKDGVSFVFHEAGHILGSAMVEIRFSGNGESRRLVFSGDLGRAGKPLVRDPAALAEADYLVMESTYGDRNHENHGSVDEQLARVVRESVERGGKLIVPIFAIERAQELIYYLDRLLGEERIPAVPVYLDSPMAADVTAVFRRYRDYFDAEAKAWFPEGYVPLRFPGLHMVRTQAESKALNRLREPMIIMATSGMCVAGRIKHHLAQYISEPDCTVLFIGYQAEGTLGRQILDGNPEVRIHGRQRLVRARVEQIHGFSGHADREALIRWTDNFRRPPRHTFLTHGEEESSLALSAHLRHQRGWKVTVPEYLKTFELDG
jgi:metallo-beta-lactamase family protein